MFLRTLEQSKLTPAPPSTTFTIIKQNNFLLKNIL